MIEEEADIWTFLFWRLRRGAVRGEESAMAVNRRALLTGLAAGLALPRFRVEAGGLLSARPRVPRDKPAAALAADEAYWSEIQRAFDTDRTMVNLNNGGCSPAPTHVLEAMIRDLEFSNEIPVDHMWRVLEPRIESVRRDLARGVRLRPRGDGDHPQRLRGATRS